MSRAVEHGVGEVRVRTHVPPTHTLFLSVFFRSESLPWASLATLSLIYLSTLGSLGLLVLLSLKSKDVFLFYFFIPEKCDVVILSRSVSRGLLLSARLSAVDVFVSTKWP